MEDIRRGWSWNTRSTLILHLLLQKLSPGVRLLGLISVRFRANKPLRDLSDPTRKKVNYFEVKPNETPSSKMEVLRQENDHLMKLYEKSKTQLKECVEQNKVDRVKFIDELITLFMSLSKQKNAVHLTINLLKKFKLKSDSYKCISQMKVDSLDKTKFNQTHKNELEKEFEKEFYSKQSNEHLGKNYWYRWNTKPSGSEWSANDDEALKAKLKSLEEEISELSNKNKCMTEQIQQLKNSNDFYKSDNEKLTLGLKQSDAANKTLLRYIESRFEETDTLGQAVWNKIPKDAKHSEKANIINEYIQTKEESAPQDYLSYQNTFNLAWENINRAKFNEPVPTFMRWLITDIDQLPVSKSRVSHPKVKFESDGVEEVPLNRPGVLDIQRSAKKQTNFSMYKNTAVKKKNGTTASQQWGSEEGKFGNKFVTITDV